MCPTTSLLEKIYIVRKRGHFQKTSENCFFFFKLLTVMELNTLGESTNVFIFNNSAIKFSGCQHKYLGVRDTVNGLYFERDLLCSNLQDIL